MDKKSPKKAPLKKRRSKVISEAVVSDSDESDNETPEVPEYNGIDTTLHENDDSLLSDGGWSSDDDRELVQKVKATSKQTDKVSYKTRLKQLNWSDIAFKSYTAKDCENRFQYHLKHVRRSRNLNEITVDMEINIKKCPLKKPLNSYQLFIQDQLSNVKSSGAFSETMKNLGTLYKELPPEEKAVYERKAEQLRLEYKQKRADFDAGNISGLGKTATSASNKAKTPFMLYAESKKLEESDYSKLRENYNNLSIDEKYKWVIKAVSEAQDRSQENVAKILNKEEQRIFKGQIKTSPSAYSLFVKEVYAQIKEEHPEAESKNVFAELARRWKQLDAKKKKIYMNAAAVLKEKTAQEQEAFNERHGVTPQKTVKRRKSTFVERLPEDGADDEEEEAAPSPKKRKISDTLGSGSDDQNTRHIQIKLPTKQKSSSKLKTTTKEDSPAKQESPVKLGPPKSNAVVQSPKKNIVDQLNVNDEENKEDEKEKKKKKKKQKLDSESSEHNETKSESDAVHSSSSTSSKKKSKKKEKSETIEPPTDKPASDFFTYFAQSVHTGKPHKAKKAFEKLPKKERKQLQAEYQEKVKIFVERLERYLGTLTKEEAVDYISKIKEAENAEAKRTSKSEEESSQEY